MQTFLPVADFQQTARILDDKRLGKQRVEAKQIYFALTLPSYGWKNHPATLMWRNNRDALLLYGCAVCNEWRSRGFRDSLLDFFVARLWPRIPFSDAIELPYWVSDPNVHVSHQSNLVRKNPAYYRDFFPNVPDNIPYYWPV